MPVKKPAKKVRQAPPSHDEVLQRLREKPAWDKVGRFAALGLREPWQTPLIPPDSYTDLRQISACIAKAEPGRAIRIHPAGAPKYGYAMRTGAPKATLSAKDDRGDPIKVVFMGEHETWRPILEAEAPEGLWVLGEISPWGGSMTMLAKEIIEPWWIGRVRPNYAGKRVVLPGDVVRRKVVGYLAAAVPTAAEWIETQFADLIHRDDLMAAVGLPGWTLEQMLVELHTPSSMDMAAKAQDAIKRIAALASLAKAHEHVVNRPDATPIACPPIATLVTGLPFTLTPSQDRAAREILSDLAHPRAMRRVLVGDVGSGKTAAFGIAVAGATRAGARVAVLLPNMPLAAQVHRELATYWPDIDPRLVTAESPTPPASARLWVGTTAIFHRTAEPFDFVVVDEEQKFSTQQRAILAGNAGHLLTSSATCIPRSQALAKYGAIGMSILDAGHSKKDIRTALWQPEQRRELFREIQDYLATKDPLLVIYPTKVPGTVLPAELSVESAAGRWEPMSPGRVRVLDGDAPDATKASVIEDMKQGRADILISTTVVEVGITIPTLRRIVIVAPERLGLTTIHQLRGRVARLGGKGWCDLFAANGLTPKQQSKLERFLRCKDGFEVADLDLQLRGFGDLGVGGTKQSGSDDAFLFGAGPEIHHIEAIEGVWAAICSRHQPTGAVGMGVRPDRKGSGSIE